MNVVTGAEDARICAAAGLISICLGAGDPPEGFVLPEELESLGIIDGGPFTGGAGI